MLIAFAGLDGAGKSTVTKAVAAELTAAGRAVRQVDRWDIVDNPAYPTAGFLTGPVKDIRRSVAMMPSTPRLLFLVWSATLALSDQALSGADQAGGFVLTDGYWMKHAASEVAYGLDQKWVEGLVAGLPQPDVTVYLRLDPETAWVRKAGTAMPYECGMDLSCSESSFLRHQNTIKMVLDEWTSRFGWDTVDAGAPLDEVVQAVVRAIARRASYGGMSGSR